MSDTKLKNLLKKAEAKKRLLDAKEPFNTPEKMARIQMLDVFIKWIKGEMG